MKAILDFLIGWNQGCAERHEAKAAKARLREARWRGERRRRFPSSFAGYARGGYVSGPPTMDKRLPDRGCAISSAEARERARPLLESLNRAHGGRDQ